MNFSAFFFSPENRVVTYKLVRFSVWMLLLPLSVFFFMHYVVFGGDVDQMHYCGLGAIIACNLVIAAYVYMAFTEDYESDVPKNDRRNVNRLVTLQWFDSNISNPAFSVYTPKPTHPRRGERVVKRNTTD